MTARMTPRRSTTNRRVRNEKPIRGAAGDNVGLTTPPLPDLNLHPHPTHFTAKTQRTRSGSCIRSSCLGALRVLAVQLPVSLKRSPWVRGRLSGGDRDGHAIRLPVGSGDREGPGLLRLNRASHEGRPVFGHEGILSLLMGWRSSSGWCRRSRTRRRGGSARHGGDRWRGIRGWRVNWQPLAGASRPGPSR
jgi:hypothetical protein